MSKINAVRFINLNYNNNSIHISDETFHMNGESTLLSLRNGGGKSVLVQMMMAPFVHKRYRDAKERPFESYFTTARPTFILVEWVLDHGAGYVMTGMMVRRRQEISTETAENLEMIQFISEYRHSCPCDIHHLPVVEKKKKEMVLKSFSACRQLFDSYRKEDLKKDSPARFFSYDMNNSAQSRQYFEKLEEYQIYYKEWETIMKKVNLKESGLSDLFADCKDEKGLVEKWMLDAVSGKLNKEKDRMKEFRNIIEKYTGQYKDNKSKIQRRDIIRRFREEASGVMDAAGNYEAAEGSLRMQQGKIGVFLWQLETARTGAEENCLAIESDKEQLTADIEHLRYQQISKDVYEAAEAERFCVADREMIALERDEKEQEYEQTQHLLHLFDCARQQLELDQQHAECIQYEQQLEVLNKKEKDFGKEREYLGGTLLSYYEEQCSETKQQLELETAQLEQVQARIVSEEEKTERYRARILELGTLTGSTNARIQEYDAKEEAYNKRYEPGFIRNILGEYEPAALELRLQEYEKEYEALKKMYMQLQKEAEESGWKQKESERNLEDTRQKKRVKETELQQAEELCARMQQELKERYRILRYFGLDETDVYDMDKIMHAAENRLAETEWAKRKLEKEEDRLYKEYQKLTQGRILELPEEFEKLLSELGIRGIYGMEWLKKNQYTEEQNKEIVQRHPFLPYALLLSGREMKLLKQCGEQEMPYTSFPVPMIVREQLDQEGSGSGGFLQEFADVSFYMLFNEHLLNEEKLKQMTDEMEQQIADKKEQIQIRRQEYESYFEKKEQLRNQTVTKEREEQAAQQLERKEAQLKELSEMIRKQKEEADKLAAQLRKLQQQIQENLKQQSRKERRLDELKSLEQAYTAYLHDKERLDALHKEMSVTKDKEHLAQNTAEKLREQAKKHEMGLERLKRGLDEQSEKASGYKQYEKCGESEQRMQFIREQFKDSLHEKESGRQLFQDTELMARLEKRYDAITSRLSFRQQEMERLLHSLRDKERKTEQELRRRRKKYGLADGEWNGTVYDARAEEYQEQLLAVRQQQYELKKAQWNEADKNAALAAQRLEQQRRLLLEKCGTQQPLPKEDIQPVDFAAEMEKLDYRRREFEQKLQQEQKRIGWYEENLTALAEYTEYMPKDEVELWYWLCQDAGPDTVTEPDGTALKVMDGKDVHPKRIGLEETHLEETHLEETHLNDTHSEYDHFAEQKPDEEQITYSSRDSLTEKIEDAQAHRRALEMIAAQQSEMEQLSGEQLRRRKGMLVRDCNHCREQRQKQKDLLTGLLNQMVRREIFADDFYRKPIEAMLTLTDDARQVIRQMQTTLQSYESLMQKIQVDISVVEEERARITELLSEYIYEVHQNLNRIDQNSTIRIREKSVKMLKITLPDWEENRNLYQARMEDFMDETTRRGIELLERNENAQEYFGVRITTKNLYDIVVGIENVGIRLYKIEEQREYPITWSQVARNSGGEGFLSAFIILSSLLYYMRKDESDLFAERNEGKVLVMDNPFAQTNASHLLKPLMDMAKKTNTQMICLSGLGGESIYNRFDNIYVLNLVAAGLRSGMQYVKAEHMRGNHTDHTDTLLVSQIEVLGQQELLF